MKRKIIILCCVVCCVIVVTVLLVHLFDPIKLDYENINNHINIQEIEGNLCIIADFKISEVNYMAKNGGTEYLGVNSADGGRCYKQSIQVSANRWNMFFANNKVIIYKNKMSQYGANSGESSIINEDMSIHTVPRYDVEIYYKDLDGTEHLIWKLGD